MNRFKLVNLTACGLVTALLTSAVVAKVQISPIEIRMQEIRRAYNEINQREASYTTRKRSLIGYSNEGGELEAAYSRVSLRKITVQLYGCRFHTYDEYYFHGGRLIFVHRIRMNDTGLPSRKIYSREENRYYFNQGRLIHHISTQNQQTKISQDLSAKLERTVLGDAREWISVAQKPDVDYSP